MKSAVIPADAGRVPPQPERAGFETPELTGEVKRMRVEELAEIDRRHQQELTRLRELARYD